MMTLPNVSRVQQLTSMILARLTAPTEEKVAEVTKKAATLEEMLAAVRDAQANKASEPAGSPLGPNHHHGRERQPLTFAECHLL